MPSGAALHGGDPGWDTGCRPLGRQLLLPATRTRHGQGRDRRAKVHCSTLPEPSTETLRGNKVLEESS